MFCPGCGAPLALGPELEPGPLDAAVSLDRRAATRPPDGVPMIARTLDLAQAQGGPLAVGTSGRDAPAVLHGGIEPAAPLPRRSPRRDAVAAAPDASRSHWNLGRALGTAASQQTFSGTAPLPGAAERTSSPGAPLTARGADRTFSGTAPPPLAAERTFSPGTPLTASRIDADRTFSGTARGVEERTFSRGAPPALDDGQAFPLAPPAPRHLPPLAPPGPVVAAPEPSGFPCAPLEDEGEPGGPAHAALDGDEPALDLALPDAEVEAVEVHLRRAPPSRRAIAWAIDCLPFGALLGWGLSALLPGDAAASPWGLAGRLAEDTGLVTQLAAGVLILFLVYQTLCHALAGATLGKWIAGVRVAGPDGHRPSFGRSALRAALSVASVALLGLGLLLALFTVSGRALHDLVARTWVVEAP